MLECERFYDQWVDELESFGSFQRGVGPTEHRPKLEPSTSQGRVFVGPLIAKKPRRIGLPRRPYSKSGIAYGPARLGVRTTQESGKMLPGRRGRPMKKFSLGLCLGSLWKRTQIYLRVIPAASLAEGSFPGEQREEPKWGKLCLLTWAARHLPWKLEGWLALSV